MAIRQKLDAALKIAPCTLLIALPCAVAFGADAGAPAYVSPQASPTAHSPRRAIMDVDPGIDDEIGLLLALRSPELRVEAVTVVAGNVTLEQGTHNALRVLALAHRTDIPVAKGASKPLRATLLTATQFHGVNGMGGVELPESTAKVDSRTAADLIIELAHSHPRDITLIATGPLTNVATALRKDPSIAKQLSEIILMGGSTTGGNVTPAAEFNIHDDPEAARVVFDSGVPITMVGLNAAAQTLLTRKDVREMAASSSCIGQFVARLGDFYLRAGESYGHPNGSPLYDPLAVAIAIDKTLAAKTEPMRVDIETKGEFTYGETVVNSRLTRAVAAKEGDHLTFMKNEPVAANADVPTVIAGDRFISLLVTRLTAAHDGC